MSGSENSVFGNINKGFTEINIDTTNKVKQQEELNKDFKYVNPEKRFIKLAKTKLISIDPIECLFDTIPCLKWLPQYNFKQDVINDVLSGIAVAIMNIPQGITYSILAQIPPVMGLYVAVIPVLAYFIFGTSRHNSMGSFAICSLLVGQSVQRLSNEEILPGEIATSLCFVVGFWHLIMYILRLGVMSSLLSETLVSGFTTGAAVHVLTSQIKHLLGINLGSSSVGSFEIINTYIRIYEKIEQINWNVVIISSVFIVIICINNEILKVKLAKYTSIPFPIELLAVVSGIILSTYFNWSETIGVNIIGDIPTGFPMPDLPRFDIMHNLIADGLVIAIISYTITVSIGLLFAHKEQYEIGFNQELLALGVGNILGSFFSCMPFSASPSRTSIQYSVGGKTQIVSLISSSILVIVLLWVAPVFETVPICILASIIVVALKGMLWQVFQFKEFLKLSKIDAIVWIGTFATVVIVSLEVGLVVGISLSIASIFVKAMKPYCCLLGRVPNTELYLDISRYKTAIEIKGVKIFHFSGCLNFVTKSAFKEELFNYINLDQNNNVKCLIVDFSSLTYVDPSGVMFLKTVVTLLTKNGISVIFSGTPCKCYEKMKKCGLLHLGTEKLKFFLTTHDAVIFSKDLVI